MKKSNSRQAKPERVSGLTWKLIAGLLEKLEQINTLQAEYAFQVGSATGTWLKLSTRHEEFAKLLTEFVEHLERESDSER